MGTFEQKTGRSKYSIALDKELRELIDKKTGHLSRQFSTIIKCPLCKSPFKNHQLLFVKRGYSFVKCNSCNLIFSNPQILANIVAEGFKNKTFKIWANILNNETQLQMDTIKYQDVLFLIESQRKIGSLLDIGYTGGVFIHEAAKHGWQVVGLEHTPETFANAKCINPGRVLYQQIHKPFPRIKNFDCITLFEFLEHLPNPISYLNKVKKLLNEDGLLFLLLPNVGSFASKILHEKTAMFDGRYQITFYSIETIKMLLEVCGFKVIHYDTIYTSINPVLQYLNFNDPYGVSKDSSDILLTKMSLQKNKLEDWIIRNNLGYKMRILAKKIK